MKTKITAISILMTLAASFMPYSVMAESSLTIKGFNATKSAIMIDFNGVSQNECIDLESARGNIELEKYLKDGTVETISDFEITVQDKADIEAVKLSVGNTVVIKPKDGISTDALYRVQIAQGLEDTVGINPQSELSTGWFLVDEIYAEDFETGITSTNKDTVTPVAPYAWVEQSSKGNGTPLTSTEWTASYRQGFTTIGDGNGTSGSNNNTAILNYNKFMLRNNGQQAYLNQTGLPLAERVSDYTIEAELGLPKSMNKFVRMDIRNSGASASDGYGIIFSAGNYANKTADITLLNNTISAYQLNDNVINVRMSAIGNDIACYIDDDKIFETTNTTITRAGGIGVSGGTTYNSSPHITLDNVSLTKLVKYGDKLPKLTVDNVTVDGSGKVILKFSGKIDEDIRLADYIELIDESGEKSEVKSALENGDLVISAGEALPDGVYKLNIKSGLYSDSFASLENTYQVVLNAENGNFASKVTEYDKPEITNETATVKNKKLEIGFDYQGGEINSPYEVYASSELDGEYTLIDSGVIDSVAFEKTVGDEYKDCYIKIKIFPENKQGYIGDIIWIENIKGMFTPEIKSVEFTDNFETGSVEISEYIFEDINEDGDLSEIQWYAADAINSEYKAIDGANTKKLIISEDLKDKFVKVYITPKTNTYPYEGEIYVSDYFCRTHKPEARNVRISGESTLNGKITGEYDYYDPNNREPEISTETGSTYLWYRKNTTTGKYEPITNDAGEKYTGKEYTIEDKDIGTLVKFAVIPKKTGVPGEETFSEEFAMPALPEASDVTISGTLKAGYTVIGMYNYSQINDVKEGNSLYKWYVNDSLVSEDKIYTIKDSDVGKKLVFEVTPVSLKEPCEGISERSAEMTITKKSSNSGGSVVVSGGFSGGPTFGTTISQIQNTANNTNKEETYITNFTDISESAYKKEIIELYDMGIIKGVSETEFAPVRNIKRAEFITLMVRMLGINVEKYNSAFSDVNTDDWYADNIQTAYNYGLISGFEGKFRPNDSIKREEIIKILIEAYERKVGSIIAEETDIKNVSDWALGYANKAVELDIIGEKEFVLNEYALREEAAVMIFRFIEKVGEVK